MSFEWDVLKSEACLQLRGFDFAFASFVFRDRRRLERQDSRRTYWEVRFQTLGEIGSEVYHVVDTYRGKTIRIISAREADEHERKAYREGGAWD